MINRNHIYFETKQVTRKRDKRNSEIKGTKLPHKERNKRTYS